MGLTRFEKHYIYQVILYAKIFALTYSICHDTFVKINNRRSVLINLSSTDGNIILNAVTRGNSVNYNDSSILASSIQSNDTEIIRRNLTLTECSTNCKARSNCVAFNYISTKNVCEFIIIHSPNEDGLQIKQTFATNLQIANEPGSYYMEKICLEGSRYCDNPWAFDVFLHMELKGHDDKYLNNLTRDECMEACLLETDFACRSLDYNYLNSTCVLSRASKTSQSSKLISSVRKDYFENMCLQDVNRYCKYLKHENKKLAYHDDAIEFKVKDLKSCMNFCTKANRIPCSSLDYNKRTNECVLSDIKLSDAEIRKKTNRDVKVMFNQSQWDHYQKRHCLNAKLDCKMNEIRVTFKSNEKFNGIVYPLKAFHLCHRIINNKFDFKFSIPIRQTKYDLTNLYFDNGWNRCRSSYEKLPDGKHRFSNYIYIQKHKLLQTIEDFLIPIYCTYTSQITVESNNIDMRY